MAIDTPGQHEQPRGVNDICISASDEVAPDGFNLTVNNQDVSEVVVNGSDDAAISDELARHGCVLQSFRSSASFRQDALERGNFFFGQRPNRRAHGITRKPPQQLEAGL